jgi:hypothetical protein
MYPVWLAYRQARRPCIEPNRLKDGRYVDDGVSHQLPLTDPDK